MGNSLGQGLELLPVPTPTPQQGSTKVGRPPTPPRKPGSLFLSLGPLFPQSQSRKAGSSWLGGVELLLPQGSSCYPCSNPTCQARLDSRVIGDIGMREKGAGGQLVRIPREEPPLATPTQSLEALSG